ncbi:YafY family protein [Reyranella sp. CPCC 100927]|uniref:helix-turn-helix transcriptional regulator n=1 Tax=Reyranella sp. CPCC 100927 TaxID=2599616 RepID=UPI0011B359D4|nr:YafY family protein [Reyranella sp. CPCC 100927]TWS98503.1 YafY family transcriptional regulator [Reyranella sp. CPCC 100927]
MRRADRLFDILQILRSARRPLTAAALAAELEVTVRTVYRDIATLQARRIPIEGAAGIGYLLRRGFDLPPLMFTAEEVDAIAVGARLVRRLRDRKLQQAANNVLSKVMAVLPEDLRPPIEQPAFYISDGDAVTPTGVDLAAVRGAIRAQRKMRITYVDDKGKRSERTVWPIAMAYYVDVTLIAAWCELRADYRHFRVDRVAASSVLEETFPADNGRLMAEWLALRKERPDAVP